MEKKNILDVILLGVLLWTTYCLISVFFYMLLCFIKKNTKNSVWDNHVFYLNKFFENDKYVFIHFKQYTLFYKLFYFFRFLAKIPTFFVFFLVKALVNNEDIGISSNFSTALMASVIFLLLVLFKVSGFVFLLLLLEFFVSATTFAYLVGYNSFFRRHFVSFLGLTEEEFAPLLHFYFGNPVQSLSSRGAKLGAVSVMGLLGTLFAGQAESALFDPAVLETVPFYGEQLKALDIGAQIRRIERARNMAEGIQGAFKIRPEDADFLQQLEKFKKVSEYTLELERRISTVKMANMVETQKILRVLKHGYLLEKGYFYPVANAIKETVWAVDINVDFEDVVSIKGNISSGSEA